MWRWSLVLWGAGATVIAAASGWVLQRYFGWWSLALLVGAAVVGTGLTAWMGPPVVWSRWSYELTDDALELAHGVILREHSVIPWSRVQHVDISHGPLDRRFGLAKIKIHTASAKSDAELPGLDAEDAERLRLDILSRYSRSAA